MSAWDTMGPVEIRACAAMRASGAKKAGNEMYAGRAESKRGAVPAHAR
jgi:hypothetical protein